MSIMQLHLCEQQIDNVGDFFKKYSNLLLPVLVFRWAIEFSNLARNGISTPNWCCVPLSTSTKWVWLGSRKLSFGLCFFPSLYEAGHFPRHLKKKNCFPVEFRNHNFIKWIWNFFCVHKIQTNQYISLYVIVWHSNPSTLSVRNWMQCSPTILPPVISSLPLVTTKLWRTDLPPC